MRVKVREQTYLISMNNLLSWFFTQDAIGEWRRVSKLSIEHMQERRHLLCLRYCRSLRRCVTRGLIIRWLITRHFTWRERMTFTRNLRRFTTSFSVEHWRLITNGIIVGWFRYFTSSTGSIGLAWTLSRDRITVRCVWAFCITVTRFTAARVHEVVISQFTLITRSSLHISFASALSCIAKCTFVQLKRKSKTNQMTQSIK